jgi:hypothetical protein
MEIDEMLVERARWWARWIERHGRKKWWAL